MPKNILAIIDFSEKIGHGHNNRVNSILNKLHIEGLEVEKIFLDSKKKKNYINNLKKNYLPKKDLQLLIVDSFLLSDDEINFLSKFFNNVLIVDDWIGRKLIGDNIHILDWTVLADRSPIHLYQGNVKKFLGLEYCPIQSEQTFKKTNDFLIYLGSSIKTSIYVEIIEYISRKYKNKKITVIDKKIKEIKSLISSSENCSFLDFLNEKEFKKNLLNSKYFITTGGWSCYQAIAFNCIPLLISLSYSNTYFDCYGIVFGGYGQAFGFINKFGKLNLICKDLEFNINYIPSYKIGENFILLNQLLI